MVQPSSIDVRLDRFFRVFENHRYPHIDPAEDQPDLTRLVEPEGDEPFILHPGEFVLGSTYEVVTLPDDVAARLEGKSSLGRLGLLTHSTAGFIDPGLLRPRDAGARQRRDPADQAVAGDEDRPALLLPAVLAGRAPLRLGRSTARATRASAARRRPGPSRASTGLRSTEPPRAQPSRRSASRCSPVAMALARRTSCGVVRRPPCPANGLLALQLEVVGVDGGEPVRVVHGASCLSWEWSGSEAFEVDVAAQRTGPDLDVVLALRRCPGGGQGRTWRPARSVRRDIYLERL